MVTDAKLQQLSNLLPIFRKKLLVFYENFTIQRKIYFRFKFAFRTSKCEH